MNTLDQYGDELKQTGFTIIENIYSSGEIEEIIQLIDNADKTRDSFRKSADLFAIRQFLKEIPAVQNQVFNNNLRRISKDLFGAGYFVVKSIFFDKPETSNWFVSYHQDLTISVDKKIELTDFGPWTVKQDQFSVQPRIDYIQNIFTVRIHLDDTTSQNGALKVIPGSHLKGVCRPETIDLKNVQEITCDVSKGGIMIMKPLLLHSSGRTTNNHKRRVIHLEFSDQELPAELQWAEKLVFN
jgi:ectoine hydroxylase-related dioxygenase (phytanoyl-CoA dioxygenase family)